MELYGYRYEVVRDFLEFKQLVKSYIYEEVCNDFEGFLRLMDLDGRSKEIVSTFRRNREAFAQFLKTGKQNKTAQ